MLNAVLNQRETFIAQQNIGGRPKTKSGVSGRQNTKSDVDQINSVGGGLY